MSFISYAQNFEDVMLWRALKHVENGFYIHVGANHPTVDSVTKAFYERGWHGINIEPLSSHHADLAEARPRDINLQCVAGAVNGEIEVWECDVNGLATASTDVVAEHTANGNAGSFHRVPVSQLTNICAQHVSGEIHFLKIDVEGFEKSVIVGMDFSRFRPWILVIDATRPNSTEEIHDEWEGDVLSAGYVLAYTDGLNRFYVAQEHSELLNSLRYPPNVFDGFIRSEQLDSELRAQQAESKAAQAVAHAREAEGNGSHERQRADQLNEEIVALRESTSWRITAPVGCVGGFVRKLRSPTKSARSSNHPVVDYVRKSVKRIIRFAGRHAMENQRLKSNVLSYLAKRPALKARLRRIVLGPQSNQFVEQSNFSPDLAYQVQSQMVFRDSVSENGSARRSSLGVNGSQKTPLESYFY